MLAPERFAALCRARDRLAGDDVAVSALAAEAGLSTGRFIKQFSALFGDTPHQHRVRARLSQARLLLAQDRAVTDVCFAVGFRSLGSFSDAFAQRVGMRPSTYRRRRHALVSVPGLVRSPGCFGLLGRAFAAKPISEKRGPAVGEILAP